MSLPPRSQIHQSPFSGTTHSIAGIPVQLISVFLLLLGFAWPSMAEEECLYGKINCYECTSENNTACGDPFNSTGVHSIKYCEGCCVKMVTNRNSPNEIVRRTCTKDIDINLFIVDHVCMDASDGKGHMCFCESNLCNTGSKSTKPVHQILYLATSLLCLYGWAYGRTRTLNGASAVI